MNEKNISLRPAHQIKGHHLFAALTSAPNVELAQSMLHI
jgi:hypothetical protein